MTIQGADAVLRELLDRGLIARGAAVDGDVISVSDTARRWFRFLEKPRAQFFVRTGEGAASEAALFHALAAAPFLPDVRVAEPELFVVETFPGGLNVIEYHRTSRRVAEWLPALIGRTLAAVHTASVPDGALSRGLPATLRGTDPAFSAPVVAQAVGRVAAQWSGGALLHGDAGFDHIFVAPESERRIHLVGWDEARIGDPAWDLGAVIESYYAWSLDPKIVSDVEGPACPFTVLDLTAAMASLRDSYVTAARLDPSEARARLVRAFGYAGVRLIDRVNRVLRKSEPVTPQLTQMMQASIALMTAPSTAADAFFAPPRPVWPQPRGTW